jgi:outer membrane protein OmpA-like peptidoglycan-associated protein
MTETNNNTPDPPPQLDEAGLTPSPGPIQDDHPPRRRAGPAPSTASRLGMIIAMTLTAAVSVGATLGGKHIYDSYYPAVVNNGGGSAPNPPAKPPVQPPSNATPQPPSDAPSQPPSDASGPPVPEQAPAKTSVTNPCGYKVAGQSRASTLLVFAQTPGAPPIPLSVESGGRTVTLKEIFLQAGIDVEVAQESLSLREIDMADDGYLQGEFTRVDKLISERIQASGRQLGDRAITVAMSVPRFQRASDEGLTPERVGMLVDTDQRRALAVFYAPLQGNKAELFLTLAHELAHVFSVRHGDWRGQGFGTQSTIEGYSGATSVHWCLSERTQAHILSQDPWFFVQDRFPWEFVSQSHAHDLQLDPPDAYNVIPDQIDAPRFGNLRLGFIEPSEHQKLLGQTHQNPGLTLLLTLKHERTNGAAAGVIGELEPFDLEVTLRNQNATGWETAPKSIDSAFGDLHLLVTQPDGQVRVILPPTLADARLSEESTDRAVRPRGQVSTAIKPYFSAEKWIFRQPGQYALQVFLHDPQSKTGQLIRSEALTISYRYPKRARSNPTGAAITKAFPSEAQQDEYAKFVYFGGLANDTRTEKKLKRIVANSSDPTYVSTLSAALARSLIRRARLEHQAQWLREAEGYIQKIRHVDIPESEWTDLNVDMQRAKNERPGSQVDASGYIPHVLQFDTLSSVVKDKDLPDVWRIAQELFYIRSAHGILLIGHSDQRGYSHYWKRRLSCERARSVRAGLIEAGVPEASIIAVGAGDELPYDRRDIEEAWEANRRVELFLSARATPEALAQQVTRWDCSNDTLKTLRTLERSKASLRIRSTQSELPPSRVNQPPMRSPANNSGRTAAIGWPMR